LKHLHTSELVVTSQSVDTPFQILDIYQIISGTAPFQIPGAAQPYSKYQKTITYLQRALELTMYRSSPQTSLSTYPQLQNTYTTPRQRREARRQVRFERRLNHGCCSKPRSRFPEPVPEQLPAKSAPTLQPCQPSTPKIESVRKPSGSRSAEDNYSASSKPLATCGQ